MTSSFAPFLDASISVGRTDVPGGWCGGVSAASRVAGRLGGSLSPWSSGDCKANRFGRLGAVGRLTYTVRVGSLSGEVIGTYRHPGTSEPQRGTLLSTAALPGGPWRVSDYVQTDESAPLNNTLAVEQILD